VFVDGRVRIICWWMCTIVCLCLFVHNWTFVYVCICVCVCLCRCVFLNKCVSVRVSVWDHYKFVCVSVCDLYTFKFVSLPIFLSAWVRITDQEIERKQKKNNLKKKEKKRFALTKFLFPNVFREKQAFFIIRRWPKIWRVISYPSCDKSETSNWKQKVKK
jgi:hypothetical protein